MTENSLRSSASSNDDFIGRLFSPWLPCWGVVLVENVADAAFALPGGAADSRFAFILVFFLAPEAAFGGGERFVSRIGVVFLVGTLFSLVSMGKLSSIVDSSSP